VMFGTLRQSTGDCQKGESSGHYGEYQRKS